MIKRKKDTLKESVEKDIDLENFNVDDLVERPRIASVPKYNINNDNEVNSVDDDNEETGDTFDFLMMPNHGW